MKMDLCHLQNKFMLTPEPNGHHFADDILKSILLNENVKISIKI